MIYTDRIHLVANSIEELHNFCNEIGIKRCWFEGVRKGHPHYDIPKYKYKTVMDDSRVKITSSREVLKVSKESI